jgi:hypothetical protein
MGFSADPYRTGTSSISMVATAASDRHAPVQYLFDFTGSPTGGSGGTDSSWQTSTSYTDGGLGVNHQYGYRVEARDSATTPNSTGWSPVTYRYTDIETPTGITFGSITTSSIAARSTSTPSGLTRGSSGLNVYNATAGRSSGWKQNNNLWTCNGLSPNTQYTFKVAARNGDGAVTPDSPIATRCTLAAAPVAAPFSSVRAASIQANWSANGNPAGTQYCCENTTAGTSSGWMTSTSWVDTGLGPVTSYTYRVKARNANNVETAWTALGSSTTPAIVSLTVTPATTTVARGGTLQSTMVVTNNTDSSRTFQYWSNMRLTNGSKYPTTGELYGPMTVTLAPFTSWSGPLSIKIPATAPVGKFTLYCFAGLYAVAWDEEHFKVTITQ